MAYVEILHSNGLTVTQWDEDVFAEYIGMLWWKHLMGTSSSAVIQVKENLVKAPGDSLTIGLRGLMQGGKVTGDATGIGNEGTVAFYNQNISIDNVRQLIRIVDVPMSQKRINFDLLQQSREALTEKAQIDLDQQITTDLSSTASGRVQGRYLYGGADSNWNATHTTALTNVNNTTGQLTSAAIDIAKRKALIPVNATAKVRPARIKNGQDFEQWYFIVAHPYCIRDLIQNDAAWKNAQLNIPPRSEDNVIFTGNSFKGAWDGTAIYEYDQINLVSSTIQVAANLYLGAQAHAVVWGQRPKFGEEELDVGHTLVYEIHEIRGSSKLVFNRPTPEDQGVVHVFSAAVAD